MDAYRAIVAKRDQRAFLPRPIPEEVLGRILQAGRMTSSSKNREPNRFIGFGYVDPERAAPPPSVARRRLPLAELVQWDTW